MRNDCSDLSATFLTAGMLKLPAATTNTIRISQIRRGFGAAVVIGIYLQFLNPTGEHGSTADKLTNKPEVCMKVCQVARASACGGSLAGPGCGCSLIDVPVGNRLY